MDRPPAPSGVMSHSSRMELQRRRTVFALLNSESEDPDPSDDEDDRLVKSNTMFYHGKSSSKNLVLSVLDLKGKGRVPMTKRFAPLDFQAPVCLHCTTFEPIVLTRRTSDPGRISTSATHQFP